jgi:hypothetical protein
LPKAPKKGGKTSQEPTGVCIPPLNKTKSNPFYALNASAPAGPFGHFDGKTRGVEAEEAGAGALM